MRNWYSIKALAAPEAAEISIYDEIGMWGVDAASFNRDLKALGAVKDIQLSINSPGGSVWDGFAIYNMLRNTGANITVKVMGIAASIASVIAMAGNKIVMPENAFMMVHNPSGALRGDAGDMREMADLLDKMTNSLVATYVARTGKSEEEVRALLDAETFMSAAEAKDLGFADEVIPAMSVTASFETDRLPENVRALFLAQQEPEPAPEPTPEPEPVPEPEQEPTDEPAAISPFAEQIEATAKAAGMSAFAALWALDDSIQSLDDVKARVKHAQEVVALCKLAQKDDMAASFINENKPVADVRAALRAALVAKSDASNIDTSQPNPVQQAKAKATKSVAQIYAERAQRTAQAS